MSGTADAVLPPGSWVHVNVNGKTVPVPVCSCEVIRRDDSVYELHFYSLSQAPDGQDAAFCLEVSNETVQEIMAAISVATLRELDMLLARQELDATVVPIRDKR